MHSYAGFTFLHTTRRVPARHQKTTSTSREIPPWLAPPAKIYNNLSHIATTPRCASKSFAHPCAHPPAHGTRYGDPTEKPSNRNMQKKNKEEICSACDGLNKHTHKRTVHGIFIAPNKQNSVRRRRRPRRRSEPGLCFFGSARPQHYEYDLSARCSDDRTTHTSDKLSAFKPVPINN